MSVRRLCEADLVFMTGYHVGDVWSANAVCTKNAKRKARLFFRFFRALKKEFSNPVAAIQALKRTRLF
jgi:hypothetical protein